MTTQIISFLFALLLAGIVMDASAQSIYRSVDDEGRTTFTDRAPAQRARHIGAPRQGGKVDVSESARRLKQARTERRHGAQPQAGELILGAGQPRANHRYWQRQEKLRLVVE